MPRKGKPSGTRRKRRGVTLRPTELSPRELAVGEPPDDVRSLADAVAEDGGAVLAAYREPLGGHVLLLCALPIDLVAPTPFQRDVSDAHVRRLTHAMDKTKRFLDPVIAVRETRAGATDEDERKVYWIPNGYHRLTALRELGAKTLVALVVPETAVAYQILALNIEKAHNLRERALEVVRLAESLAVIDDRPEVEFENEFEEAALVTLGMCYQQNGRFSGSAYHSVLRRCDRFLRRKLPDALMERRLRADKLLELNDLVNEAVVALKAKGMQSPYLKAFIVARINPLRFTRKAADFDETIDKMLGSARRFDPGKIRSDQIARTGGPTPGEE
jgi:ParB family chromosome partitioning protein